MKQVEQALLKDIKSVYYLTGFCLALSRSMSDHTQFVDIVAAYDRAIILFKMSSPVRSVKDKKQQPIVCDAMNIDH